jgi:hypothetical protein
MSGFGSSILCPRGESARKCGRRAWARRHVGHGNRWAGSAGVGCAADRNREGPNRLLMLAPSRCGSFDKWPVTKRSEQSSRLQPGRLSCLLRRFEVEMNCGFQDFAVSRGWLASTQEQSGSSSLTLVMVPSRQPVETGLRPALTALRGSREAAEPGRLPDEAAEPASHTV